MNIGFRNLFFDYYVHQYEIFGYISIKPSYYIIAVLFIYETVRYKLNIWVKEQMING